MAAHSVEAAHTNGATEHGASQIDEAHAAASPPRVSLAAATLRWQLNGCAHQRSYIMDSERHIVGSSAHTLAGHRPGTAGHDCTVATEHDGTERDPGVATEHTVTSRAIEDAESATEHPEPETDHVSTVSATTSQLESLNEDCPICDMDIS